MKKCLFSLGLLVGFCLLVSCNSKSPEQAAQEAVEREMQEMDANQMKHEKYIDSLLNVATGLDGQTLVANRRHALSILRSEYPQMSEKWDKVEISISNGEVYGDDENE